METNKIVNDYSSMIHELLSCHPIVLAEFDLCFARGEYRSAFVLVEKAMRESGLTFASKQDQIAQRFFWGYIY